MKTQPDNFETALDATEKGIAVVPCHPGMKHAVCEVEAISDGQLPSVRLCWSEDLVQAFAQQHCDGDDGHGAVRL